MATTKKATITKAYHHGNVRLAALVEVKRLLSGEDTRDFTLPQVAKSLGVSHAALYRHFNGKAGMLAALAIEGYHSFAVALDTALEGRRDRELLRATAVTYCAFARQEPALFRAMFHPLLRDKSKFPELEAVAASSFRALGNIVGQLSASSTLDARFMGALIWSSLHGIAALESDAWLPGRTGLTPNDLHTSLPEKMADVLFVGLQVSNSLEPGLPSK